MATHLPTLSPFQYPKPQRKTNTNTTQLTPQIIFPKKICSELQPLKNANRNSLSSISSLLKTCPNVAELKRLHAKIIKLGLNENSSMGTKLLGLYATFHIMDDARLVFETTQNKSNNSFLWITMIRACAKNGLYREALEVFNQMQFEGIEPNEFTFSSVINAFVGVWGSKEGKQIHALVVKNELASHFRTVTALVKMYGKCGSMEDARQVFDEMPDRDVFLWNTLIAEYVQNRQPRKAVESFCQMHDTGIRPNEYTLISVIPAFAEFGTIEHGKRIHDYVVRSGFGSNPYIATALINMYASCGGIDLAKEVFDRICERDAALWTAMIDGYATHGDSEQALEVFNEMQKAGVRPDHVTFGGVLSICSRAGLVDEGRQCFDLMTSKFGIEPDILNYVCMVKLLGQAGHLDEAYDFIKRMPLKSDVSVWGALLSACKLHCNSEVAEHAAEHLFILDPKNSGWYAILSEIYAATDKWDEVIKLKRRMEDKGLRNPQ